MDYVKEERLHNGFNIVTEGDCATIEFPNTDRYLPTIWLRNYATTRERCLVEAEIKAAILHMSAYCHIDVTIRDNSVLIKTNENTDACADKFTEVIEELDNDSAVAESYTKWRDEFLDKAEDRYYYTDSYNGRWLACVKYRGCELSVFLNMKWYCGYICPDRVTPVWEYVMDMSDGSYICGQEITWNEGSKIGIDTGHYNDAFVTDAELSELMWPEVICKYTNKVWHDRDDDETLTHHTPESVLATLKEMVDYVLDHLSKTKACREH